MKRLSTTPRPTLSPILADAVYNKRSLCASLQWEHRTWAHAVKEGLRVVSFGKQKFVLGREVLAFFERLADQQAVEGSGNGEAQ
jgi:hypothetical protein